VAVHFLSPKLGFHGSLVTASMEACGCRFKHDGEHYCWLVAGPMVAAFSSPAKV